MNRLRVSDNARYLENEDGTPFFYLADTAWELFHRANRSEAEIYLRDRAAKGFTVIQAVVLAEFDGIHTPNALGDLPLINADPTRPNPGYFSHVDFIVDMAASLGLTVGMLPTWGDKWNLKWGVGPEIFTPENAAIYGEMLGKRYADKPLIWILGGDRPVESATHRAIIEAMAAGLRRGDGGSHLMTFHPPGGHSSSEYFHDAEWLDFNQWQSGHSRNGPNYACIASDYAKQPVKPCMDGEPGYEDHPSGFDLDNGYLDDYDVRKAAYWAMLAGAFGHTYGCHPVWQLWQPGREAVTLARRDWREALNLPGAGQMRRLRSLMESRPFHLRTPDQTLLVSEQKTGSRHAQAARAEDGSYAMIYLAAPDPVEIDLDELTGEKIIAWWYDPRTGVAQQIAEFSRAGRRTFTPPPGGPDWVLVLDDAGRGYGRPGGRR